MDTIIINTKDLNFKEDKNFNNAEVAEILCKLAGKVKELKILQDNLLKEKQEKENLQADFEHALMQLRSLTRRNIAKDEPVYA